MDDLFEAVNKKKIVIGVENIAEKISKSCETCHKLFTLAELISHKKVHTECLPHNLIHEGVDTENTDSVILNGHWLNPIYTCSVCRKIFPRETQLRIHQVQAHGLSFVACLTEAEIPETLKISEDNIPGNNAIGNSDKSSAPCQIKRHKCRYCEKLFLLPSQCKSHENAHVVEPDTLDSTVITAKFVDVEVPFNAKYSSDSPASPSSVLAQASSDSEANAETRDPNGQASIETDSLSSSSFELEPETEEGKVIKSDCGEMELPSTDSFVTPDPIPPKMEPHSSQNFPHFPFQHSSNNFSSNKELHSALNVIPSANIFKDACVTSANQKSDPGPPGQDPYLKHIAVKLENPVHVLSSGAANVIIRSEVLPTQTQCDEKQLNCLVCGESFSESQIFPHAKTHLKRGQKECAHCNYKSTASGDLRDHISKHYQVKPYKCPHCSNAYGWQSGLKKHLASHETGDKGFTCRVCAVTFSTQRLCRRHELTHEDIGGPDPNKSKPKKAKRASKVIKTAAAPEFDASGNSMSTISGDATYGNDQNYPNAQYPLYSSQCDYTQIQNQDQNPRVYDITSYTGITTSATSTDTVTHQQTQSYYGVNSSMESYNNPIPNSNASYTPHPQPQSEPCQPQGEVGNNGNSWPATTTQQAKYYGGYTNTNEFSLPQQQVQNHNNWNEEEQHQIGAYRTDLDRLHNHNSDNGGHQAQSPKTKQQEPQFREPEDLRESETCKTCGIEISIKELAEHIQSHILPGQKGCTLCKYKCNTKIYLAEHYNIHYGLKPYSCNLCYRRFSMRSHLRTHTQQVHHNSSSPRYQCRYCNKLFVRPNHLRTHEMIHEGQEVPPSHQESFLTSLDSDSNSNSNASFRTPKTPERSYSSTATSSPSNYGIYSRSNTNSPQSSSGVSSFSSKIDPNWNGFGNEYRGLTTWPQYFNTPNADGNDQQHWNNVVYSPLVKSDVNWIQPPYDASPWQSSAQNNSVYPITPQKIDTSWSELSNGFYNGNTSGSVPPSASVQDLWSELHLEEMKWFPESSTGFTADGIPMITELAPLDGFSYTEMLYNATADLPGVESSFNPFPDFIDDALDEVAQDTTDQSQVECLQPSQVTTSETRIGKSDVSRKISKATRNPNGRGKKKLAAEAKHRLKLIVSKPKGTFECDEDVALSPRLLESSGEDEETEEDPDSLSPCLTCGIKFARKHLLVHIRSHLNPGQTTCDLCDKTYSKPLTLREHVHIHYKLKPYKCAFCDAKFSTKYSRKTHEVFTHEQCKTSIVECPYTDCGKPFAMRSELQKHIRAHAKRNGMSVPSNSLAETRNMNGVPKTVKRTRRSKSSSVEPNLKETTNTVAESPVEPKLDVEVLNEVMSKTWEVRLSDIGQTLSKKCPLCQEQILLANFIEHKQNHREVCHHCQQSVPVTEVITHGQKHVGERTACELCGFQSKQRAVLWEHMNSHLKLKPIRCLYCGQGFASRTSLRSHYLALHTNFRPHSCRFCDKPFVQHTTMVNHELIHLEKDCPCCSQSFMTRKDTQIHFRTEHVD